MSFGEDKMHTASLREYQVKERLEANLDSIRFQIRNGSLASTIDYGTRAEKQDSVSKYMESFEFRGEQLEKEVHDFKGPHFTKIYRTLQAEFLRLQQELDGIDDFREDLRNRKKTQIVKIEKLAGTLAAKAHDDGKHCPKCEIQD